MTYVQHIPCNTERAERRTAGGARWVDSAAGPAAGETKILSCIWLEARAAGSAAAVTQEAGEGLHTPVHTTTASQSRHSLTCRCWYQPPSAAQN